MVTPQYHKIRQQMENIVMFLEQCVPIASNAMVNYYSKSLYKTCLSSEIRDEVTKVGANKVMNLIFDNQVNSETPHLYDFIQSAKRFYLSNNLDICLKVNNLEQKLVQWGYKNISSFRLEKFMNSKKSHEVEVLSAVAAAIYSLSNTTHLIDIGDGKGYLSSMLALHHKIPVLGVDASCVNTNSASKRLKKLQKMWKDLELPVEKIYECDICSSNDDLYKQITLFVDENVNFVKLTSDIFLSSQDTYCLGLVGLHTCGDLASTSIKIFNANDKIKTLCNVSCCYHLLSETNEVSSNNVTDHKRGFPMSKYLNSKQYFLGRDVRMLAAQSLERILQEKKLINSSLFYRAVFQVFLKNHGINTDRNVGKLRKECKSFVEYARKAINKMELEVNVSDNELNELFNIYHNDLIEMNVYYLLRCHLAPVIESFILLDRLLYLHEQGYENSYLVQLFDPVISPRCYGLLSIKNINTEQLS